MQASDYLLISGEADILTDSSGPKLEWTKKFCIVTQEALLIYKKKKITEAEEHKVLLKEVTVRHFPAATLGFPTGLLIELVTSKRSKAIVIDETNRPKDWVYFLTFATCWSNYENFCNFRKLNPKTYLLKWGESQQSSLHLDFSTTHQYATIEFLRENTCVTELNVEHLDNHHDILVKILRCFPPTQLTSLLLNAGKLRDATFASLHHAILFNVKLQKLDLSRNFLSVKTVALLIKISPQIPFLKVLSLKENPLFDVGVAALLPTIFKTLDLVELDLTSCKLSNESAEIIHMTLSIAKIPLSIFRLNDNDFSHASKAKIMHAVRVLRSRGKDIKVELNPMPMEPEVIEEMNMNHEVLILRNRNASPEKRLYKSNTIAKISSRVLQLDNTDNFADDLRKLAEELVNLESHYPKSNMVELQDVIVEKLDQAIASDDLYFIETLYNAAKNLGIRHKSAENKLQELKLKASNVIEALHFVLNPRNYNRRENLSDLNRQLDRALEDASNIGLRGELVNTAKKLASLRNEYADK